MRFKGIICLTKVNKNQTQTERNENTILFNLSRIEIQDDNKMILNIEEREVCYVASSKVEKNKDEQGRILNNVEINWVKCFEKGYSELELINDVTDILIITREIFDMLLSQGYLKEEIYKVFKEKDLGQMSSELSNVTDFSALKEQIIE